MGMLANIFGKQSRREKAEEKRLKEYRTWDAHAKPSAGLLDKRMKEALQERHWKIVAHYAEQGVALTPVLDMKVDSGTLRQIRRAGLSDAFPAKRGVLEKMPVLALPVLDNQPDKISWMIKKGASADQIEFRYVPSEDASALKLAVVLNRNSAVKALMDCGADPHKSSYGRGSAMQTAELLGNLQAAALMQPPVGATATPVVVAAPEPAHVVAEAARQCIVPTAQRSIVPTAQPSAMTVLRPPVARKGPSTK